MKQQVNDKGNGKMPVAVPVVTIPNSRLNSPAMFSYFNPEAIDDLDAWEDENFYLGQAAVTEAGATTEPTIWESISKGITDIIPAYSQYQIAKGQADIAKELNQINLKRAQLNQPPLNLQDYTSRMSVPTAQVNVGVTPQTQKILLWGGVALAIGIGAYMLANR